MRVIRYNNVETSFSATVDPIVSASAAVLKEFYLSWTSGGEQRSANWSITVGPDDFGKLARAMMMTDPDAALDAFSAAIAKRMRKAPLG